MRAFLAFLEDHGDGASRGAIPWSQNEGRILATHRCRRCSVRWTPSPGKAARCWVCGGGGRLRGDHREAAPGIEGWGFQ